ncbi:probable GTP-binding protein OBGC2 isoform X2 [Physcomitrium patens]|uniref:OBG-type G domain-containing protein n=1 Tax=Physcomitrium patens TaxID=3218 RepID=A0A2K1JG75_PHYPA|nr:probable GTP-binding protein OBGC2 isoform X2 [Physcomitrium patens]PNR40553.1 hypothetical protein PHYPA_017956 [Physcomitrium patens]|eukprot:XP_024393859.1 probable GTP-binding protein OBGC2 isoform X2 [Physcomitrella patens]
MQAMASTSCGSAVVSARGCVSKLPFHSKHCAHHLAFTIFPKQRFWQGDQRLAVTSTTRTNPINCSLLKENANASEGPKNLDTEPHKYFDQVVITVRSGDGGNGATLKFPKPKVDDGDKKFKKEKKIPGTYKRGPDGSLILPLGGHGGDVILVADESADTLLPLHRKKRHNAKRGSNVSAMGTLSPSLRDGLDAPVLRIPVPVGTVVKRKRGGKFLADLAKPGDEIMVARGGRGGISVVEAANNKRLRDSGLPTIQDPDDKVLTLGAPGEEIALELTLRVVADIGLVGLPNAGKSSLLAAVTVAKPEIAAYPFTTLMPNLGCLEGDPLKNDGGFSSGATMADLPGLIKDAHLGKGLGRMFLRHLRRTRVLVHVVDASSPDPVEDYTVLREELHLYNPEYVRRPHIVVLNKLDLPEAREKFESLREVIQNMGVDPEVADEETGNADSNGSRLARLDDVERDSSSQGVSKADQRKSNLKEETARKVQDFRRPEAVVGISARVGEGMKELLEVIRDTLQKEQKEAQKLKREKLRARRLQSSTNLMKAPQWQL